MLRDDKKLILLAFLFALVPTLLSPVLTPWLRINYFAPFLTLMFYKRPLQSCLWYAFGCGFILDLLTARLRLGLYIVNYCLTIGLLYGQKRHFFEDKLSTLPIMTALFSILSTVIQIVLLKIAGTTLELSWAWLGTDLVLFPLADAAYALVWFAIPAYLLRRRPQNRDNTLSLRTGI